MKAIVLVQKITGELDGITVVSVDADIRHVLPSDTHDIIEISVNHPVHSEQRHWRIVNGKLQRKSEIEIEAIRIKDRERL